MGSTVTVMTLCIGEQCWVTNPKGGIKNWEKIGGEEVRSVLDQPLTIVSAVEAGSVMNVGMGSGEVL